MLVLVFIFSMAFYFDATIPRNAEDTIITSVSADGNVSMGNRFVHIYVIPLMTLAIFGILWTIPKVAVYRRHIDKFYERFYGFKVIILLFLAVVYLVNLAPALGFAFEGRYVIIIALAVLLFYLGHILKHIHRNYFIGFMTPWALASDKLWDKTHKFGGAIFEVCGIALLASLFFPAFFLEILLTIVIAGIVVTGTYSYLIFSRNHRHH